MTDSTTKARKREVDLALKETELREALAKAEVAEHEAALKRLERLDEERCARVNAAHDARNHVLWFTDSVNAVSAGVATNTLRTWNRLDPTCDIEIIFKSPGGSVIDGMALFDEIVTLSQRGGGSHHITTKVRGYAASMSGILLQAGDRRVCGSESYLMIHEVASLAGGKIGEIKDEVSFLDSISERVTNIFVDRSEGKTNRAQFKRLWDRKDVWLTSDQALRHGFVDRVG